MTTAILSDATIAQDDRTTRNFFLAGIVLLCYDHLLTLGREIQYIWVPGRRRSSLWYLFVRYFALCSNMSMMSLTFGTFDSKTCAHLMLDAPNLTALSYSSDVSTLVLRVIALYSFDRRAVFTLVTTALIVFVVAAWLVVPRGPTPNFATMVPGCHSKASRSQDIRQAGAWEAQLGADVLLLAFTLYHGYTRNRSEIFRYGTLWRVIVRDGAMYFGIICLSNLANILMYYFGDIITGSSLSAFSVSLSVTMICRLMLNLHDAAAINPETSVFVATPIFAATHTMELETLETAEPSDQHRTVYSGRDLGEC
ncbi:hypothetical protein B0H17DRAFT_1203312 [Mycena rosella]|uniref:DUF6533 domain-containing protein n=1 Tax=Mycena rosella TaxID=1033263 RepID=A0AAD7GCH2_MYCRO|nr:hypothetical protein B0H17DRAFT_1203312 [Mycena rosella]